MGGLAREFDEPSRMIVPWLDASERSGMPLDPRLWSEAPIGSSYPACMAVKAAQEQGPEAAGRYLRALREGLMCFRRKLDTREALVAEARGAGLDGARFGSSLGSHAIVEAFGADLDEARSVDAELPSLRFGDQVIAAGAPYAEWRAAALAAGAAPVERPLSDPLAALSRFGRAATVEIATLCDLPLTRASAELWRLAAESRLRPVRVLTGTLWELA
jgi:predicted DsbA family dithiol-disulfide isomerase